MKKPELRRLYLAALLLVSIIPGWLHAIEVSNQHIGNVTPFSFDVVWQVSDSSSPEIVVYSDSNGTNNVTGTLMIEYSPIWVGDPTISSDYAGRSSRREIQSQLGNKNLFHARIHSVDPATQYYVRIKAVDQIGTDLTTDGPLPLLPVMTATENAFVSESRLLRMDFSSTTSVSGAIAILDSDGLPYPLIGVVGSGNTTESAYFNLDNLLDASGQTNLNPSTPLDLLIHLIGQGVPGGVMDYTVSFGGGFTTAMILDSTFAVSVGSYQIDPIGNQQVGEPFTISISALDVHGNLITNFSGSLDITSNLSLTSGGGPATGFADGVLDHPLTVGESGSGTVTVTDGSIQATSNSFDVFDLGYQLTLLADPAFAGTVIGAGFYNAGSNTPIEAVANPNFLFNNWSGDGAAEPGSSSTTVSMVSDRSLTAVFVDDPSVIDYQEWKELFFGQQSGDPVITAPGFDFDTDLQSNLLEYLSGQDPTVADADPGYPLISMDSNGVPVFSYIYDSRTLDLSIAIHTSTTPAGNWSEYIPVPADVQQTDLGAGLMLVEVKIQPLTSDPVFVRFTATLQSP